MRYVLYARKSSESEERQVQSIEDQRRVMTEFAASHGLEVVEEVFESKSAKAPGQRPGFERLLSLIERGKADAIICWQVNRLTRNPIDAGKLSWLLQNGVLRCIQTPDRQYLPSDNVLLFSIETGTATQYILDLKKNVARGTDTKLAAGWFPHRAPEGYRNNLYDKTIEADGERFVLLQRAWKMVAAGTHTPAHVLRLLNDEWGYRTRPSHHGGGKPLSRSAGFRIFTSFFYAGYFQHGGRLYQGKHPAMVTLDEFEEARRRILATSGKAHIQKHEFAYAGLMRCGRCGLGITAERQRGHQGRGDWTYYHCANRSGICTKKGVREDRLEAEIDACLAGITITDEFRVIVTGLLERWIADEFGSIEVQYGRQSKSLMEGERMLNELVEMRLRGLIDDALFTSKRRELEQDVTGLRLALGRTQERLDLVRSTVHGALDFRQQARAQFITGDLERRREIARALGVRYVVTEGRVLIEMNPLLCYQQAGPVLRHGPGGVIPVPGEESNWEERNQNSPQDAPTGGGGPAAGADAAMFEPRENGFHSTKRTHSDERVLHGWTRGTESEQNPKTIRENGETIWENGERVGDVQSLYALFAQVCEGSLVFRRPACLTYAS
jgi:site-specific DNA recombinase